MAIAFLKINFSKRFLETIEISFLTGLMLLFYFYATSKYGSSVTLDSMAYVDSGINFWERGKFVMLNDSPYIYFPPLYPFLIGILYGLTSVQADTIATLINFGAAAISFIIFLSRFAKNSFQRWFLGAATIFMYPFFLVHTSIFAEPLFICLVLIFLIYLEKYTLRLENKQLILMTTFASLAMLQRYVGLILLPFGCLVIAYLWRNQWKKLLINCSFFTLSLLPIVLWMIRNHVLYNSFTGSRISSDLSLVYHFYYDVLQPVSFMIAPTERFPFKEILLPTGVVAGYFLSPSLRELFKRNWIYYSFSLFYILSIWLLLKYITFLAVPARTFAPIALFFCLLAKDVLQSIWIISSNKIFRIVITVVAFIWLAIHVRVTSKHAHAAHLYGAGGERVKHIIENNVGTWIAQNASRLKGTWQSNNVTFLYWTLPYPLRDSIFISQHYYSEDGALKSYREYPTDYFVMMHDDSAIATKRLAQYYYLDTLFSSIEGTVYQVEEKGNTRSR